MLDWKSISKLVMVLSLMGTGVLFSASSFHRLCFVQHSVNFCAESCSPFSCLLNWGKGTEKREGKASIGVHVSFCPGVFVDHDDLQTGTGGLSALGQYD